MSRRWKEIDVTEAIIAQATKENSTHCMIADAIKVALPSVRNVSVDLQTIRFSDRDRGERYIYFTPGLAQRQLLRFDQGVVVDPWTLRLPTSPAQIVPILARRASPNRIKRPSERETKTVKDNNRQPVVSGGRAPVLGALAYSDSSRVSRRIFGVKAAGKFDPTR